VTARTGDFQTNLRPAGDRTIIGRDHIGRLGYVSIATLLFCLSGCRGRAYEDLYKAKMAQEIRVLEDQLYDADYQNRVLRDQLTRARDSGSVDDLSIEAGKRSQTKFPSPILPERDLSDRPLPQADLSGPREGALPDLNGPNTKAPIDQPIDQQTTPQRESTPTPSQSDDSNLKDPPARKPESPDEPEPLVDPPSEGLGFPSETQTTPGSNPADSPNVPFMPPLEMIPPSDSQLMEDPVIPGEVLPPPNGQDASPDKIVIPPGTKTMQFDAPPETSLPIPDHLELHDGFSGGHQFDTDEDVDGLYLVVTVLDEQGKALSLDDFDVDAELTVVVIDPNDDSTEAPLGRWEFSPAEVRDFVRRSPIDGIYIPVAWQDRVPVDDEVIVHIRMAAAEEEMRCQGRIRTQEKVAVSSWLPRG
jgi:hypothetical protein